MQMFVMIPNGMTSGGLPGITRMITHIFPWDYSLVYYSISMVIVITAWITMGKRELERIIALAITYPVLLFIFEHIHFQLLDSEDRLLASLIMGVFYGLASGIGYVGGYSSGGTDTLARVLKYKLFNFLRVADIKLVIDVTIIIISAFVFDTNVAMYAVITSVVTARVISAILTGYNGRTVKFEIVPSSEEKGEEIIRYVIDVMDRDVTSHIARGEYTKTERRTLSVACTPHEALDLKRFVAESDPAAFSVMSSILTVWGENFSNIKDVYNN
ncbi:MAG: YitT family protein [Mogibacterium sp.]|nr:YitT family protein [Mogibacterium sp.]